MKKLLCSVLLFGLLVLSGCSSSADYEVSDKMINLFESVEPKTVTEQLSLGLPFEVIPVEIVKKDTTVTRIIFLDGEVVAVYQI